MALLGPSDIRKLLTKGNLKGLLKALKQTKHHSVRRLAVEALGQLKDARALEPLCQALDDEVWEVRKAAATALGQLGDPRAVEPLGRVLEEEDLEVREAAATALGQLGAPAVDVLGQALKAVSSKVRSWAVAKLDDLGDPRAAVPLGQVLNDEDLEVREAAAEALRKLGR